MNSNRIEVLDMTSLFTKELLLYSLFDFKFKRPVRIAFLMYVVLLLLIWSLPIALTFGVSNVYLAVFAFVPPFPLAASMSKPIWGFKPFTHWFATQVKFLSSPKAYFDFVALPKLEKYNINHVYTLSRAKDYLKLYKLKKGILENGRNR